MESDLRVRVYLVIGSSILLLVLWNSTIGNELVPLNYYAAELTLKRASLRHQNDILYEELLSKESLTVIATEAAQMGFVPMGEVIGLH